MEQLSPEVIQSFAQIQAQIDQYHQLRSGTNRFIDQLQPAQKQTALLLIQKYRDPGLEGQALKTTRDLLTSVYGRDPTKAEFQRGLRIDQGMNGVGLTSAVGATILVGGLVALYGLYQSLFGRESYLQQELGITSTASLASSAFHTGVWVAAMAAVGYGSYYIYGKLVK